MHDKQALCEKIREIYPDIGECGIDLNVEYDKEKDAWIVDLKKDVHELKTHVDPEDVDACMLGKKCIGIGILVSQLKSNIGQGITPSTGT